MTIGFDVDGILADFVPTYQRLIIELNGRSLFQPGDSENPPSWNWPKDRGYTSQEIGRVWEVIKGSNSFWYSLQPTEHLSTLALLLPDLEHKHDIYYITSRPGSRSKRQTEAWLHRYLPYGDDPLGVRPTVLIAQHMTKGSAARTLGLDCYIDDNLDNVIDVAVTSSKTRVYLLDRNYNQGSLPRGVDRVATLGEMFDRELANL